MPPKSSSKKKACQPSWYHCEACGIHITSKEREQHDCGKPTVECIRDGALFTESLERRSFTIEELKDMPAKYVNNLIFISEGAMDLAQFYIGQKVAVNMTEDASPALSPLVRTLWPVPEKFLTTVFVTEEDFIQNWQPFKGKPLKIEPLPHDCPEPAKTVCLELEGDGAGLEEKQLRSVEGLLKLEMKNLIYTKGSVIHFDFYNKKLTLSVTNWMSNSDGDAGAALEEQLQQLSLQEAKSGREFFQVCPTTKVQVSSKKPQQESDEDAATGIRVTKEDVGGLDEQFSQIEEPMQYALGFKKPPKGVNISRGILLYGPTGCGKTLVCEALSCSVTSEQSHALVIKINCSELFSRFLGETEKNLASFFEQAFDHYPQASMIVLEDVHIVAPKQENNDVGKRLTAAFLSLLDGLQHKREAQRTFLVCTTSQIDLLNPALRRCGRLDKEIEISAPSPTGRAAILKRLLRKMEHSLGEEDIAEIAGITHGYVGADLANLVYTAAMSSGIKNGPTSGLSGAAIHAAMVHVKPSAMREVLIESPNVRWSDIGGQEELKLKLKQSIEWPLLHADKFKQLGIKPPKGLLMFGPPGCSKTMIAKALATESQLNFLSIKGPELFSMWVGESERAVREVFRKARQVAPAIVFFDEIDAIGGERSDGGGGGSGSSVKERVLTQLLTELDGVEALQDVTIVAATNRPDMIDKALLRPGRIDRIVYVGLPDPEARREIFRIKLRKMPISADVSLDRLVELTEGYSGAEIQAVCHEAALKTLEQSFEAKEVAWPQFEYALEAVQPRTSPDLLRLYEEYLKKS